MTTAPPEISRPWDATRIGSAIFGLFITLYLGALTLAACSIAWWLVTRLVFGMGCVR